MGVREMETETRTEWQTPITKVTMSTRKPKKQRLSRTAHAEKDAEVVVEATPEPDDDDDAMPEVGNKRRARDAIEETTRPKPTRPAEWYAGAQFKDLATTIITEALERLAGGSTQDALECMHGFENVMAIKKHHPKQWKRLPAEIRNALKKLDEAKRRNDKELNGEAKAEAAESKDVEEVPTDGLCDMDADDVVSDAMTRLETSMKTIAVANTARLHGKNDEADALLSKLDTAWLKAFHPTLVERIVPKLEGDAGRFDAAMTQLGHVSWRVLHPDIVTTLTAAHTKGGPVTTRVVFKPDTIYKPPGGFNAASWSISFFFPPSLVTFARIHPFGNWKVAHPDEDHTQPNLSSAQFVLGLSLTDAPEASQADDDGFNRDMVSICETLEEINKRVGLSIGRSKAGTHFREKAIDLALAQRARDYQRDKGVSPAEARRAVEALPRPTMDDADVQEIYLQTQVYPVVSYSPTPVASVEHVPQQLGRRPLADGDGYEVMVPKLTLKAPVTRWISPEESVELIDRNYEGVPFANHAVFGKYVRECVDGVKSDRDPMKRKHSTYNLLPMSLCATPTKDIPLHLASVKKGDIVQAKVTLKPRCHTGELGYGTGVQLLLTRVYVYKLAPRTRTAEVAVPLTIEFQGDATKPEDVEQLQPITLMQEFALAAKDGPLAIKYSGEGPVVDEV